MVCIGSRYGVAQVGMPGILVSIYLDSSRCSSKHFINLVYFVQVLGFNKIWSYLMHEFFHTKNNRSMVGGLLSNSAPVFWKFPLRIFVGFMWLQQGLTKLPKVIHDFNNVFLLPSTSKSRYIICCIRSSVRGCNSSIRSCNGSCHSRHQER